MALPLVDAVEQVWMVGNVADVAVTLQDNEIKCSFSASGHLTSNESMKTYNMHLRFCDVKGLVILSLLQYVKLTHLWRSLDLKEAAEGAKAQAEGALY